MHEFAFPNEIVERVKARRGRLHPYAEIDPARTALVVIDMQNAFMSPGAPVEIPTARGIVDNINRLAAALRKAGGIVTWVQMTLNAIDDWPVFLTHTLGPKQADGLVRSLTGGSEGHRLWSGLDVQKHDYVVRKNRFSAFLPTACTLPADLKKRGIDTVIIVGTLTSVCSESSARDAVMLDFKTIMVSDGNATRSDQEHGAALIAFIQSFGDVRTTEETIKLIKLGKGSSVSARETAQASA